MKENGKAQTAQITEAVSESVGSPTKGSETSSAQSVLMTILLHKIESGELDLRTLLTRFHSSGLAQKAQS